MAIENIMQNEGFVGYIQQIEDKLLERGMLVSAVGDSEADVTIGYETYDDGPHVIIRITAENATAKDEDQFERISDFVNEKLSDGHHLLPSNLVEEAEGIWGQCIFLNGEKVY